MACKGVCQTHFGAVPFGGQARHGRGWAHGDKRCSTCGVWVRWEGARCPCCKTSLRGRPRPGSVRRAQLQVGFTRY